MSEPITLEEYRELVEQQSRALLDVVQSVALGDLEVSVDVPEGVEVLSELAVGIEIMIDDLRAMLAEQERTRAEIEAGRQQLEVALQDVLDVQRRYLRQQWGDYAAQAAARGFILAEGQAEPSGDAWLPAMSEAVQQAETVAGGQAAAGAALALPIKLYDEVIGALGFGREGDEPWSEDEIAIVETIVEQVGWALESQRLFDEEQQARALLGMRVNELDCLNDIGRKIDETPAVPEFLEWVANRVPSAMQHPDLCVAAIEFEGEVYSKAEAMSLPCQMVQSLQVGGEQRGRVTIAYTKERDFINEESALLGDIARRVSGYVENRILLLEAQNAARRLEEERTLLQTMIDNLPDLVYVKDRQSRFLVGNAALLRLIGIETQQELLGHWDGDFFPPELAAGFYADEQDLVQTGQALIGHEEIVADLATGKMRWFSSTKVPLRDMHGEIYGLVGLGRDITERRETERILERRRSQLECLSDIGQKIGEAPSIPDFLQWVAGRIPLTMQYPDLCVVAIEFGEQVYGTAKALDLPVQMVQSLHAGGERVGRLCIAYTEDQDFLNEESALLGDIARRVSGYIENRRLFEQTGAALNETAMLLRVTRNLGQTTDEREIFEFVLSEYLGSLGLGQGGVLIFDQDKRYGTLRALMIDGQPAEPGLRIPVTGNPACEKLIATREPVVVMDALHDQLLGPVHNLVEDLGYMSMMLVPILVGQDVIGALGADSVETIYEFSARDVALVRAVADQLGVAMENRRLFQETQAALSETQALYRATRSVTAIANLPDTLHAMVDGVAEALPADRVSLITFDLETREVIHFAAGGPGLGQIIPVSFDELWDGLSGWVLREGKPALSPKDALDPRELPEVQRRRVETNCGSIIVVPVLYRGRLLGTMTAINTSEQEDFTEHDVDIMIAIATQAAAAIENATLFEKTQAALAEVEALHGSYLRRAWQDHLRQRDVLQKSAFLYDRTHPEAQDAWSSAPDLWRPEMEVAAREGRHATSNGSANNGSASNGSASSGGDGQDRAGLAIPITLRGQTIGVLGVETANDDRQWTPDDVALIEAIGDQLAQTLETARLFADTQRRAERERLIGEITTKIRASTDMHDILETAATELGRALGTSRALVRVGMAGVETRRQGEFLTAASSAAENSQPVDGKDE
jgi:PAS domain S-box-containing protein